MTLSTKRFEEALKARAKAVDTAILSAEKSVTIALDSAEKAVAKAELAAERRFASVNEFRQQLGDQAATFATREYLDAKVESPESKIASQAIQISELREAQSNSAGHNSGITATKAALIAGAGLLVAIVVAVFAVIG